MNYRAVERRREREGNETASITKEGRSGRSDLEFEVLRHIEGDSVQTRKMVF